MGPEHRGIRGRSNAEGRRKTEETWEDYGCFRVDVVREMVNNIEEITKKRKKVTWVDMNKEGEADG